MSARAVALTKSIYCKAQLEKAISFRTSVSIRQSSPRVTRESKGKTTPLCFSRSKSYTSTTKEEKRKARKVEGESAGVTGPWFSGSLSANPSRKTYGPRQAFLSRELLPRAQRHAQRPVV